MVDLRIANHGSVILVTPVTDAARTWLDENVMATAGTWFAGAIVCEPRYIADLVNGAREDGLVVA